MYRLFVFIFILLNSTVIAKETELISIVKVERTSVYSKNIRDKKYLVTHYEKGKVQKLDFCDKYDWCKIKDKELFLSKISLGIMEIENKDKETHKVIKKLENTLLKEKTPKDDKKQNTPQTLTCIKLNQIDLDENDILDKNEQKELLGKYLNKCISGKLIKELINTISTYYIDNGYITTKPYLKEQDITDGQIDVNVIVGKVENIIHSDTKESSWKIATAFAGQKDEPLNLRDLETSLEMMNRVDSADSNFELKPSKQSGGTVVEIKTQKTFPIHLSLGYSGSGTPSENDKDLTGILTIDNLFGINDILTYTYNGSRIQEEYQSTKGKELNYSFPIGSYVLEFTRSETSYRQGVYGINDIYLAKGDTTGYKALISKVLTRNQTNKLETQLSIYKKDTKNYFQIEDIIELIEVSSYITTLVQLDFMHTNYQTWGQNYTVYSIYQGKDWFGAMSDLELNGESDYSDSAKLQFTKYSIDNTIYYYFTDRSYYISSNSHIQYSKDLLYSNDQLSVGSAYTVRGYDDSNYYGANGYYVKNDLYKTFSPNLHKYLLKDISFFIGLDGGHISCESDNSEACGNLYGKSIGFTTSSDNLSSSFTWSKPIREISQVQKKHTIFNFNVELEF